MHRTARKELVQVSSINVHQVCDSDNEPQDQTSILVGPIGLGLTVMVGVRYRPSYTFGLLQLTYVFRTF